jgi:hypothetical protein
VADHADLGEDTANAATARDPADVQRAASSLESCAHPSVMTSPAKEETLWPQCRSCPDAAPVAAGEGGDGGIIARTIPPLVHCETAVAHATGLRSETEPGCYKTEGEEGHEQGEELCLEHSYTSFQ